MPEILDFVHQPGDLGRVGAESGAGFGEPLHCIRPESGRGWRGLLPQNFRRYFQARQYGLKTILLFGGDRQKLFRLEAVGVLGRRPALPPCVNIECLQRICSPGPRLDPDLHPGLHISHGGFGDIVEILIEIVDPVRRLAERDTRGNNHEDQERCKSSHIANNIVSIARFKSPCYYPAMAGDSLFARDNENMQPLAARMRPRFLDEFVGQEHILGPGKLLRRAIQADMLSSLIFYGPPGTGKTTLARVIANTTKSHFISLNAVLAGVKDVRASIDQAKDNLELHDRRTILFVDEVHRWNKSQQDALLPWVENGTVVLIGATTHNPFFEVNSALVSRSRIFQLTQLTPEDLASIADHALQDPVRGYGRDCAPHRRGCG